MEELVDLDESMQIDDSYLIESVLENLPNEDVDIDLTSTSDTEGTSTPTPHFRDDPLIPVYSSGKNRPYTTKNVAEKIINGVSTHLISSLVPHQPDEDIAFMIGTQYLGHWKDVLSDNLGTWRNDGTRSLYYIQSQKHSREIKLKPSSEDHSSVRANRYLYVYPKTPSFKRVIVTVSIKGRVDWELKSPVFVQYYFSDGKKPIMVQAHGNSKKLKPYFRTKESTKMGIKGQGNRYNE